MSCKCGRIITGSFSDLDNTWSKQSDLHEGSWDPYPGLRQSGSMNYSHEKYHTNEADAPVPKPTANPCALNCRNCNEYVINKNLGVLNREFGPQPWRHGVTTSFIPTKGTPTAALARYNRVNSQFRTAQLKYGY